ncbi:prepilin peptidase [Roseovarius nanhaiticus]|uniref:Prepilin peptidase CpaA n=1 Tax=Roseovarius nanhaiticus TaxID=573024 RepID=A0A1N7FIE9_9RHOB|nr:prepilin peptidase [Roseovarius nanhaiticus]SEK53851.1 prepilin peptidase CpaA [Roseovarius nanhaiticus]SIS00093.1 prepilin peptidase CpaA [Roseovarius nanhaiticus]
MFITSYAATWFLPFVLPICFWVAYTDLRDMKITNNAVMTLVAVYAVVGLIVLPLDIYAWRWIHLVVVLIAGIALNAIGALGAGDAKFAAAAAPFIAIGDLKLILLILAATAFFGFVIHRAAKHSPLRRLAPEWTSWTREGKYPMGLSLGGALGIYLLQGALNGA